MNYIERPYLLYLLIPLVIYLAVYIYFKIYTAKISIRLSYQSVENVQNPLVSLIGKFFPFLRFVSVALIILALAGPGQQSEFLPDHKNGLDIMIAIDVSGSMARSNDFLPSNRLEVSKKIIQKFIQKRKNDRIGLIVFAGAAYIQSPLTGEKDSLIEVLADVSEASVREQGTAIGDAIALSTYRLKKSVAKSKVMVIITDGVSNTGKIDPLTAMELSKFYKIKIYTIGVGKMGFNDQIDFDSLKKISDETKGSFYRAADVEQFQKVMDSIDRLEKDTLESKPVVFVYSQFDYFLYPAILLLIFDLLLRTFVVRYYP
jgi:Ca-activated chloride channel homolog